MGGVGWMWGGSREDDRTGGGIDVGRKMGKGWGGCGGGGREDEREGRVDVGRG